MLINDKTPEEIKKRLACCSKERGCYVCPDVADKDCSLKLCADALALIQHLEAQQPKWISVKERLPEDGELVLCILYGDVNGARVYEGAYELAMHYDAGEDDGEYFEEEWEMWDHKRGEVTNINVTHWMPLPEPPEGV